MWEDDPELLDAIHEIDVVNDFSTVFIQRP